MSDDKKITKGFKVKPETKLHVDTLFAASEFADQEDFLNHMAALYEMQQLKNGEVAGYAKHLDEMEFHSRRMVELFLSMIQTEQGGRLRLSEEHADRVAELSSELATQQDEIRSLADELKKESLVGAEQRKQLDEFEKHVLQLQQVNERGEQLISEYKIRIDSLSALVADQQEAVNQTKATEQRLTELSKLTDSQARKIEDLEAEHEREIHRREELSQDSAVKHQREIEDIKTRADLENEKALITERSHHQDQITAERDSHNAELRKLYAEMDKLRQQVAEAKQPPVSRPPAAKPRKNETDK